MIKISSKGFKFPFSEIAIGMIIIFIFVNVVQTFSLMILALLVSMLTNSSFVVIADILTSNFLIYSWIILPIIVGLIQNKLVNRVRNEEIVFDNTEIKVKTYNGEEGLFASLRNETIQYDDTTSLEMLTKEHLRIFRKHDFGAINTQKDPFKYIMRVLDENILNFYSNKLKNQFDEITALFTTKNKTASIVSHNGFKLYIDPNCPKYTTWTVRNNPESLNPSYYIYAGDIQNPLLELTYSLRRYTPILVKDIPLNRFLYFSQIENFAQSAYLTKTSSLFYLRDIEGHLIGMNTEHESNSSILAHLPSRYKLWYGNSALLVEHQDGKYLVLNDKSKIAEIQVNYSFMTIQDFKITAIGGPLDQELMTLLAVSIIDYDSIGRHRA